MWSGPLDLDLCASTLAPSIEVVDHRILGTWSARGAEEALGHWRSQLELTADGALRDDDVLALRPDALLVRRSYFGADRASGGAYENEVLALFAFGGDGLLTRVEVFEPDRHAEALARFDELTAAPPPARIQNAATLAMQRSLEAWQARDWERFAALGAAFRGIDRRRLVRLELDRDAWLASYRQMFEMTSGFHAEVLATRGERLAMMRFRWQGTDRSIGPSEIESLGVLEVDGHGEVLAVVEFDPDDQGAAYAELDARYAAGEAAPHAAMLAAFQRLQRGVAARDWEELGTRFAADFVVEDHSPLGWGTLDRPTYLESLKALVALAPDSRVRTDHLWLCDRGALGVHVLLGMHEGGAFEQPRVTVSQVDAQGRERRRDVYTLDQLDAARARFDAIAASTPRDPLAAFARPNAATVILDRVQGAFEARDWAALRAAYRTDARIENRRRGVLTSQDVDGLVADAQQLARSGARYRRHLVASAGERVALERFLWSGDVPAGGGPFEVELLGLTEVDETGQIVAAIRFDADDWRAASRDAWDRWLARDAAAAAVMRPSLEFLEGVNDHDRARLRAVLADDLLFHDRRRTGEGPVDGADAYLDTLAVLWELAPDTQLEPRFVPALERHGFVSVTRTFGTLPEGGAWENYIVSVVTVARGRITRIERFELEALDAALARLTELRPPDPLEIPPNAATRANDRWREAIAAGDWEFLETFFAPTLVFDDRRRGSLVTGGREMLLANDRLLGSCRKLRLSRTVLATAGDRLALQRVLVAGAYEGAAFEVDLLEIEFLQVIETDADGRLVAAIAFDPDDRRAASRELFERHARSEAGRAPPEAALELWRAFLDRDLERCRAAIPVDFVFHDHRRSGPGRVEGADAWMAWNAALLEQSPDALSEPLYYVASKEHGSLSLGHTFGTLAGGGEFESVFWSLWLYRDGRPVALERFEPEDLDRAQARFEELCATSDPSGPAPTAA
jgi:hypothetical protein